MRRVRISKRRGRTSLAIGTLATLLGATAWVVMQHRNSPDEARKSQNMQDIFAFDTGSVADIGATQRVGIVRAGKIIAWIPGGLPQVAPGGKHVVSYYFKPGSAQTLNPISEQAIYAYDLRTGKTARQELVYAADGNCPPRIAADGSIYAFDGTLVRYRTTDFSKPQQIPNRLPERRICLEGTIGTDALVTIDDDGQAQLYRVAPTGAAEKLSTISLWSSESRGILAATDHDKTGKPAIAFGYPTEYAGWVVYILNPKTKGYVQTDMTALGMPAPMGEGPASQVYVEELWWGLDGHLYAVMGSWGEQSQESPIAIQSLWRLDGTRWTSADGGPIAGMRQLSRDAQLLLIPESPDKSVGQPYKLPGVGWGDLYLTSKGRNREIFREVNEIAVPPVERIDPKASPTGFPARVPYGG
jgi:hypothetical protein